MRKCALATLFVLFIGTQVYGSENIYTWKDARGVIHITDKSPPDGVEIMDISPAPPKPAVKSKKQVQPANRQVTPQSDQQRNILLNQAAMLRAEEAASRQKAEELTAEAQELRSRSAIQKVKRRYRRRARVLEQEASEALEKAEAEAKKAEKIEKRLNINQGSK